MSLVESLGQRYCQEYIRNSLVVHEGAPYIIGSIDRENVHLQTLDNGSTVTLPASWLTGFSRLEYPELGYRKIGLYTTYVHRRQSAYRGLRASLLNHDMTPASYLLHLANNGGSTRRASEYSAYSTTDLVRQVMCPTYDTPEVLRQVLSGVAPSFVPSNELCIEPLHNSGDFGIYYGTKLAGTINRRQHIAAVSDSITKAVEKYL